MTTQHHRVPDLFVEQLARGELPPDRAAEVRRRLEAEPEGLARLEAIARSDAEILDALPPDRVAREVRARAAEREVAAPQARRRPLRALAPALVAVAALVVLVPRAGDDPAAPPVADPGDDGVRAKGDPSAPLLRVHRRTADGDEVLGDGATVGAGDVLQVAYVAAGFTHGVLASVDGRGAVTLHHPPQPHGDTRLQPGGPVLLGHAYELDDAPDHETFVFALAHAPLGVDDVVEQLRDGGADAALHGPDGAPLHTVTVRLAKPR